MWNIAILAILTFLLYSSSVATSNRLLSRLFGPSLLTVPSGVAVSKDGSHVLVSELTANRVHRFWLKGDKQNTSEIYLQLPGRPDNVKGNSPGELWVAFNNPVASPPPLRPPVREWMGMVILCRKRLWLRNMVY